MNSVLQKIAETKREEVERLKQQCPEVLLQQAKPGPIRNFTEALSQKSIAIIAEIKKASPSQGVIRKDFNPIQIAKSYERAQAACISVLTDQLYFQGAPEYIQQVKESCSLPILRKDFIIDPYQIYESKALGADCILLIVALLDDFQLHEFCDLAQSLGMSVLVESHDQAELERAVHLPTPLMGINNRDLHTFTTDLHTSTVLAKRLPADKLPITESGIHTREDIQWMLEHGIHTFLIGETLMRASDIEKKLAELLLL